MFTKRIDASNALGNIRQTNAQARQTTQSIQAATAGGIQGTDKLKETQRKVAEAKQDLEYRLATQTNKGVDSIDDIIAKASKLEGRAKDFQKPAQAKKTPSFFCCCGEKETQPKTLSRPLLESM